MVETKIETHPAKAYVRDERVNRIMSPARVAKLRAKFNLDGIGVFIASKRPNGELVLLDGAHRDTALMEEGLEDFPVSAVIYEGLSTAQEAQIFLIANDRLAVNILERFRLEIAAGDPESVLLDKLIRDAGFFIGGDGITCIGSLQAIYRGGSESGREKHKKTVEDTLRIISEAWGTDRSSPKEAVKGIGGLLLNFDGLLDHTHLIKSLVELKGGVGAIRTKANYHTREGGETARVGAEKSVAEVYNKGVPANKKLRV